MKTYTLWNYYDYLDNEWLKDTIKEYNVTEEEAYNINFEQNNFNYEYALEECNIELNNKIIIFYELGLWYGKKCGGVILDLYNIKNILTSDYDPWWYVDYNGDLRCDEVHHDGTNHLLYRELKDLTDKQLENLEQKLFDGSFSKRDIARYTKRIGDKIASIYGWSVRKY